MKNSVKSLLIIILIVFSNLFSVKSDEIFQEAVTAFESKDYQTSLELFLSLENEGIKNSDLYYNVGNCYFRLGNIGRSILYYKRSLKLDNNHKPAARNLDYVLTFAQDKQIEDEPDLLSSLWLKLLNSLSLNTLASLFLLFFLICIGLLILMLTRYRMREKTSLIFIFSIVLLFTFLVSIISYVKYADRKNDSEAVLMATSAIGYSGPGEDFTRVFTIHEGMIFQIEKTEAEWSLIKLNNGLGGWIRKNSYIKV